MGGWLCPVERERRKEEEGRLPKRDNFTLRQRELEVMLLFAVIPPSLPPPSSYDHLPATCLLFPPTSEGVPSEHFTMVPMDSPEGAQLTVEALSSQIHQLQERVHDLVQQLNSLSLAVQGAMQGYGRVGGRGGGLLTVIPWSA